MAAVPEKDQKAFKELTKMKYADQAKWYLNGFWGSVEKEAESVWKWTQKMQEYDSKQKKNGSALDEFMAHKFLESLGETLTVIELRAKLRKIDLDADGKMALLEYCIFRFNTTVSQCVNNPQGGGPEHQKQMDAAAALLESLNAALTELQAKLAEQKVLEANQRKALGEQNKALAAQEAATREVKKAEEELRKAVDELNAQEKAYKDACDALDAKAKDEKLPAMKRSMAANELAQLKSKDPLPLNKAKITQGAALKRVEKERKAAEAATAACAEKTKQVEEQTRLCEQNTLKIEADQKDTEKKLEAAAAALDELKKKGGAAHGALWWMEREVIEAQKYLPQSKQTKKA